MLLDISDKKLCKLGAIFFSSIWVVGDEPCVSIDFTGMKDFAKKT
jgi:hypothetical protein